MPREQFQNLTEPMYYILLALLEECCGVDIMDLVEDLSGGRVRIGPGTLYTLLARFEQEDMIREVQIQGRKRWYRITEKGKERLLEEQENSVVALKSAIDEGVRSGIAVGFDPEQHLRTLKMQQKNG